MTALLIGCLVYPKAMGFKKVLIANRGEIALRIMRALRDMGIEAAIIYGKEDRLSLPVQFADDATFRDVINPLDAYLDIEAVVQAAKDMGCDAVHPGYGFLAENAGFVKYCVSVWKNHYFSHAELCKKQQKIYRKFMTNYIFFMAFR